MKKKAKKKVQKLIHRAIKNPDNFSMDDIAHLILLKKEDDKRQSEQDQVSKALEELVKGGKTMGFSR
jgi:hypothetical protein